MNILACFFAEQTSPVSAHISQTGLFSRHRLLREEGNQWKRGWLVEAVQEWWCGQREAIQSQNGSGGHPLLCPSGFSLGCVCEDTGNAPERPEGVCDD